MIIPKLVVLLLEIILLRVQASFRNYNFKKFIFKKFFKGEPKFLKQLCIIYFYNEPIRIIKPYILKIDKHF